jgi:hypothetical protein
MKTYDFSKGKRGAVLPVALGKVRITIRLDCEILNYFRDQVERAGGGQLPDPYEHCVARLHRRQEVGS